jgi:hypothetical protein
MYSLAPHVVMTEAETGAVLLNQRTGRYWMINDTGALVLRRLLDGSPVNEAASELTASYAHADPDRAERDTVALLDQLRSSGLVTS